MLEYHTTMIYIMFTHMITITVCKAAVQSQRLAEVAKKRLAENIAPLYETNNNDLGRNALG